MPKPGEGVGAFDNNVGCWNNSFTTACPTSVCYLGRSEEFSSMSTPHCGAVSIIASVLAGRSGAVGYLWYCAGN